MSHVNTPKCHSSQHFIAVFFKGIHLKMSIHASRLEALHGEIHSNTQPYNYFSHSNLFHLTHLDLSYSLAFNFIFILNL